MLSRSAPTQPKLSKTAMKTISRVKVALLCQGMTSQLNNPLFFKPSGNEGIGVSGALFSLVKSRARDLMGRNSRVQLRARCARMRELSSGSGQTLTAKAYRPPLHLHRTLPRATIPLSRVGPVVTRSKSMPLHVPSTFMKTRLISNCFNCRGQSRGTTLSATLMTQN